MRSIRFYLSLIFLLVIVIIPSCKKYLEEKPQDSLVRPESVADLQGMMDNTDMTNFPYAAEILCDDYYLSANDGNTLVTSTSPSLTIFKKLYVWQRYDSANSYWYNLYENVATTNIALDELPRMKHDPNDWVRYNNVKGSALFLRAFYFYHLAQLFAKPYNEGTANSDLGVALRLDIDVEVPSVRASVKQTYEQIISDLKAALPWLPSKPLDGVKTRPCIPAVYGMLARTYLSMKQYDSAGKYADLCLSLHDSLMDYNSLNATVDIPIMNPNANKEVIFSARSTFISTFLGPRAKIDSNLYKSYAIEDMRKQVFFKSSPTGGFLFKGDYDGVGIPNLSNIQTFYSFTGIVTDEMYLIKAECAARKNDLASAMSKLNTLLQTRYKTGQFTPLTATTANEALTIILTERRKELLRRGTRWTDIKRLTGDAQFQVSPQRVTSTQTYSMPMPYLMLLPKKVIDLSGMPQN